ncbi:MAG TPA: 2,3,4,5-tetrahydropyridine-2,6-dicarboxylate N-succinyltransferase [Acidobacteriaceae bacterium]|nr:2,3,4,5-tetrahydropyridine-2,6-dicarboxylate N-succinyltransferase [Acidobacteriaceae bacterium]
MTLQSNIEQYFAAGPAAVADPAALSAFLELRDGLEAGTIRSAEPDPAAPTGWRVNAWVKQGILLGFRLGHLEGSEAALPPAPDESWSMGWNPANEEGPEPRHALSDFFYGEQKGWAAQQNRPGSASPGGFPFVDKHTFPRRRFTPEQGIRIVPGGSSVRAGAYLARGVVAMPPMYVNVGAYVDEGTMIDSHALVGSCAQIGKRVHLSAAAQVGGVLEPVNASPVILEDDVLVGGNCGVYEGTLVRRRAVLAAGTILTRGTPVYDVVHGEVLRATADAPLVIPEDAVVVPGARAIKKGKGEEWGLSVYTPVIVKYRDEKTELSAALEDLLR